MSEYWKNQNLEGNGLQTINQQYSRLKREARTAYFLCTLFPFGAHQFYLKAPGRGILFLGLSISSVIILMFSPVTSIILLVAELLILAIDITKMDMKIVDFNKNLKMNLSLQTNTAPPKDFQGRYQNETPIDDYVSIKNNEVTAFETKKNASEKGKSRVYSFAEQEALLKEMSKRK